MRSKIFHHRSKKNKKNGIMWEFGETMRICDNVPGKEKVTFEPYTQ